MPSQPGCFGKMQFKRRLNAEVVRSLRVGYIKRKCEKQPTQLSNNQLINQVFNFDHGYSTPGPSGRRNRGQGSAGRDPQTKQDSKNLTHNEQEQVLQALIARLDGCRNLNGAAWGLVLSCNLPTFFLGLRVFEILVIRIWENFGRVRLCKSQNGSARIRTLAKNDFLIKQIPMHTTKWPKSAQIAQFLHG